MAELVMNIGFGTTTWDAQVSDTVGAASYVFASASRFSDAFNSGIRKLQLAHQLSKYSNFLSGMMESIYAAGKNPEASASSSKKAATKEEVESGLRSLEYLYEINRRLYQRCEANRLTNYSLMAASLRNIDRRSEQLMDVIDWLKCYVESTPSKLDALFADAREKLENGEVYDLAELR
jgi:hypothetical protein